MEHAGAGALVVVLTATCIASTACGAEHPQSKSFKPGASEFQSQPVQLPQGRRAAVWDASRGRLWILTAEDTTRRMSLTSYDPATQRSTTSVISDDDSNFVNGALTVDASHVWAAWGRELVQFDPDDASVKSFGLPQALTGDAPTEVHVGDSRAVLNMVEANGRLWMNVDGVSAIAMFDSSTSTWSSETPSDSATTPMSSLAATGQSVWVDRKTAAGLTLQAVPAPASPSAPASVSDAAVRQLPVIAFAARDAQHLAIVTAQSQIEDFDVTTGALRPSSVVVEGIMPSVSMAGGSTGDLWAWRRTGSGDALVHIDANMTSATDVDFHDVTVELSRNPTTGGGTGAAAHLVDPAVQTITPTPYGVFVTTRYGSDGQERSPYAGMYVVKG